MRGGRGETASSPAHTSRTDTWGGKGVEGRKRRAGERRKHAAGSTEHQRMRCFKTKSQQLERSLCVWLSNSSCRSKSRIEQFLTRISERLPIDQIIRIRVKQMGVFSYRPCAYSGSLRSNVDHRNRRFQPICPLFFLPLTSAQYRSTREGYKHTSRSLS